MAGRVVEVREAKVDDFNVACLGDEDVFDFEIYKEKELDLHCKGGCSFFTSMDDIVEMTIHESTTNLPSEFSSDTFSQTAMADDIVQHLTAVDVFKDHIVMVLMDDHLSHTADVRMVKKHGESGFSKGPYFL